MIISEFLEKSKPTTVFSELNKKDVPWKDKYSNTVVLDNLYQYSHSNRLICASLCDSLDLATLVEMIYTLNIENWNKLYENYTITYNPIENYSMTEKGKKTNTGTQNNKQSGTARSESTSNIYAYNVNTSNPASSSIATSNPNLENVRTDNLVEENNLTRSGNVGVTTSAEMIEENIKLWIWKFFDSVFKDIDRVLTIGVYEV